MKHLSHFVKPRAKKINTSGSFDNLLAFINPDKSIVIVAQNDSEVEKTIHLKLGNKTIAPTLKPNTFNTFLIK